MKFLVLMWAVFQMFSFTASDTNSTSESHTLVNSKNKAKPGCNSTCGDLVVPYPFGVGDNSECYINEGFRIYCNTSANPPKPSIYKNSRYASIKVISDSTLRISNIVASTCVSPNGTIYNQLNVAGMFPFLYSLTKVNKFTVIGCEGYASLTSLRTFGRVSSGCMVYCSRREEVVADECTGNGCCQSSIHDDINGYVIAVRNLSDDTSYTSSFSPCTYAFVGEENVFKFKGLNDLNDTNLIKRIEDSVPRVLEWAIGNQSCSEAKATDGFACQSNSICVNSTRESGGYRCECKEGYEGNPYLSPGCQDINECDRKEDFPCYGTCINTPGNYTCKCKKGYSGDGKIPHDCKLFAGKLTIIFILGYSLINACVIRNPFCLSITYILNEY